jgi:hypothetical protein
MPLMNLKKAIIFLEQFPDSGMAKAALQMLASVR